MEPVLDVSDLAAIAAMAAPDEVASVSFDDRAAWRAANEARHLAEWTAQARVLAAAGVRISPSHRPYRDREGVERLARSTWGAFLDTEDVVAELVDAGRALPGQPLVLFGVPVQSHSVSLPVLPDGYPWIAVANQTAGVACHHRYFVGMPLDVRAEHLGAVMSLARFADQGGHSCLGGLGLSLTDLRRYAETVERLGFTAEVPWAQLEEGCYPLDVSCAATLSDTPIPADGELHPIDKGGGLFELLSATQARVSAKWAVWVLGENCD